MTSAAPAGSSPTDIAFVSKDADGIVTSVCGADLDQAGAAELAETTLEQSPGRHSADR